LDEAVKNAPPDEKPPIGRQLGKVREDVQATLGEIKHLRENEIAEQKALEARFRELSLDLGDESWSLADLLTFFWDGPFFYIPNRDFSRRRSALRRWLVPDQGVTIPTLLIFSHGAVSGGDKGALPEDVEDDTSPDDEDSWPRPPWVHLRLGTAFGHETDLDIWHLPNARRQFIEEVLQVCQENLGAQRGELVAVARRNLRITVGDSRWPWNEISLWNYADSIAALFKAVAAQAVLDGQLPIPAQTQWRLLHISFDGLGFLSQAHHVSDLLGRRAALNEALDAAQTVLETEFPVGNEIYRDEHGSIFVVANRPEPDLLGLTDDEGTTLRQHIHVAFAAAGLGGELKPEVKLSDQHRGKELPLHQIVEQRARLQRPDVETARGWWPAPGQPAPEICSVCRLRPVGHGAPDRARHDAKRHDAARKPAIGCQTCKTLRRKTCYTCHLRRGRRSQNWAQNEDDAFHRTIWINEVADANGRAALIVGQFDLRGWLDGKLIATLRKNDSFARIRRCWDTTQQFWQEVQTGTIPEAVGRINWRLGIEVSTPDDVGADLGDYHVYEWPLGRGITLSVVWDSQRRCFIATDNLAYLAGPAQLGRFRRPTDPQLRALYVDNDDDLIHQCRVEEPSGYGQPRRLLTQAKNPEPRALEDSAYVPAIPLLAEPATFMALVPADKAMAVMEAIRAKYAAEMGRVRGRLPLHLGLVVFPRSTPLRAVLDAGRVLLDVAGGKDERWTPWTVESLEPDPWDEANPPDDGLRTITFANGVTWQVPLFMGDGKTPDRWYAHCLKVNPSELKKVELDQHLVHVSQLQGNGTTIWVRPSTFDYVFLDTTGRRFEIAYDAEGRRLGRPGWPFDLEAVRDFPAVWQALTGSQKHPRLKSTQLHALLELARTKAGDWGPGSAKAVNQLLRDALLRAAWPKGWKAIPPEDQARLLAAVEAGWLPDLLDFYLSILKVKPTQEEVD